MPSEIQAKNPVQSKVYIFNVLSLIASLLPQVQQMVPETWQPYAVSALAIVNIVLRHITVQPVSFRAPMRG